MDRINSVITRKCFVHWDGKLQSYDPECLVIDLKEETIKLTAVIGGQEDTITLPLCMLKLYNGEEEFERGEEWELPFRIICALGVTEYAYIWEDNNAKRINVSDFVKTLYWDKEKGWHTDVRLFHTSKECFDANTYIVKDENGNETLRDGFLKRIQLTPEQMEVVKEFEAILEKMDKAGIEWFAYQETDEFFAYNANNARVDIYGCNCTCYGLDKVYKMQNTDSYRGTWCEINISEITD